jgi:formylglycine-generating enzyme required for sulfatase activity
VNVDWCDAYAYCQWAGKRLCGRIGGGPLGFDEIADATQSQWHRACSAGGTQPYPYGDVYDRDACNGVERGAGDALPVGQLADCEGGYPGIFDLSGNIWEWEDACDGFDGASNCRMRGGSFNDVAFGLRCSADPIPGRLSHANDLGFRCCAP